jgi:AcrR family transcriptional regulator
MSDRPNRRELLVDTAARLFIEHGYAATSVRQIADAVGFTEAALYYHFKDGKRGLLQEVFECHMPDLLGILEEIETAGTFYEFIMQLGRRMLALGPARIERLRWIISEFPRMSGEERALFHNKHMRFQNRMTQCIEHYGYSPDEARVLMSTIVCTLLGYGFVFLGLGVQSVSDVSAEAILEKLASSIANQP